MFPIITKLIQFELSDDKLKVELWVFRLIIECLFDTDMKNVLYEVILLITCIKDRAFIHCRYDDQLEGKMNIYVYVSNVCPDWIE